jgi:hypothetical protein
VLSWDFPVLSVVLITPDSFHTVARTCRHLAEQTIASSIELVLCVPREDELAWDMALLAAFGWVKVVETGTKRVVAHAKAMGVRAATAPYVAFLEEHAFPEPRYGESLVAALEQGYAAAGPLMINANPRLAASWANFVIEYGPWAGWREPQAFSHLPGNNGSYRRDVLLSFGERLEAMLDAESLLHWSLTARGERLRHEPAARVHHVNITAMGPFGRVHFHYARMFAAARSASWPIPKRWVYALGGWMIPLIRLRRHWPDIHRVTPRECRRAAFWVLFAYGLAMAAAGEIAGYLAGAGQSREAIYWLEFHRPRYLAKGDAMPGESLSRAGA